MYFLADDKSSISINLITAYLIVENSCYQILLGVKSNSH